MKRFKNVCLIVVSMTLAFGGYAQTIEDKNVKTNSLAIQPVKEIEHQPIVIIPYEEEDVDDLLSSLGLDSLDFEFGIGGDELIPASDIYSTWSNIEVNPYKQEPIKDTIPISLLGYNFPLPKFYRVTSEFGQRRYRYHYGIDLKVNIGDTVVSSFGGMVRIAQTKNKKTGYGKYVVIRHFNGLETFYAHLDEVFVEPDQMVTCGEVIGLGGNTGRSTGPHLHYELRYQGRPINPRDFVDFDSALHVKSDTLFLTANNFKYPKTSSRVSQAKKSTSVAASTKTSAASSGIWTVKKGDTLSRIAARTGRSVNYLCKINNIPRDKVLKLGQKIKY